MKICFGMKNEKKKQIKICNIFWLILTRYTAETREKPQWSGGFPRVFTVSEGIINHTKRRCDSKRVYSIIIFTYSKYHTL